VVIADTTVCNLMMVVLPKHVVAMTSEEKGRIVALMDHTYLMIFSIVAFASVAAFPARSRCLSRAVSSGSTVLPRHSTIPQRVLKHWEEGQSTQNDDAGQAAIVAPPPRSHTCRGCRGGACQGVPATSFCEAGRALALYTALCTKVHTPRAQCVQSIVIDTHT
jgi:hypothetical protein